VAAIDEEGAVGLGRAVEGEVLAGAKRLAVDDQLLAGGDIAVGW
jgi:hypothetical protein